MQDMRRLIVNQLLAWKASPSRRPLILEGARQVGKTYIVQEFGRDHYRKLHYFNFESELKFHDIFAADLNPKQIIDSFKIDFDLDIDINQDLLFFDEVQACPRVLTSLKYFAEEMPQLHLIAAGSLLGVKLGLEAYPVGKVDQLEMYPMTFAEFLLALGKDEYFELVQSFSGLEKISLVSHSKLFDLWKHYLVVGGLPAVVKTYVSFKDDLPRALQEVRAEQQKLINAYNSDIAKHSGKVNSMQIEGVLSSAALQLGSTQDTGAKKFSLKDVIPKVSSFSRMENALHWLIKAGLIIRVPLLKTVALPLKAYAEENKFKLFIFDVGILGALADLRPATILSYDFGTYKGFFAENFVAQEFIMQDGRLDRLFCWQGRESEIEFLRDENGFITPYEVKSGNNLRSKSMSVFVAKYQPKIKVKISAKEFNYSPESGTMNLPIYLTARAPSLSQGLLCNA